LPRSAAGQGEIGTLIEVKDYQPGDLVFFTGSRNVKGKVGHVGMIVKVYGENDFDFIHSYSPKRKGIIIQHISVRKKGYLFVKRVIQ
jgi:cell wall-associated NlpC family hydrolase